MKAGTYDVGDVLSALQQAYYAMYAALKATGALEAGELSSIISGVVEEQWLNEGAADYLAGIAEEIEKIDKGGRPTFGVIDGGKGD